MVRSRSSSVFEVEDGMDTVEINGHMASPKTTGKGDHGGGLARELSVKNLAKELSAKGLELTGEAKDLQMKTLHRMPSRVLKEFKTGGGLTYEEFCKAVKSVGLQVLASRTIFDIFDASEYKQSICAVS